MSENNYVGITLALTSMCDTGCEHCMDSSTIKNPVHFPKESAEKIMEEVRREEWDFSVFLTGGGEPLMHPDFLEVIDIFGKYQKTIYVGMVTSGFLEGDTSRENNLREFLKKSYVSEAYTELSFNLYHSSFSKRFGNVMKLLHSVKEQALINVRMCCSYENCGQSWLTLEKDIRSVADGLGGDYYVLPAGIFEDERPDLSLVKEVMEKRPNEIDLWMEKLPSFISQAYVIRTGNKGGIILQVRPVSISKLGRGNKVKESPWAGIVCDIFRDQSEMTTNLLIYPDGSVYPECCCQGGHMLLGRIGENPLAEMIQKRDLFFDRMLGIILSDKRMFEWGTDDTCNLCRKIVAEKGIELK